MPSLLLILILLVLALLIIILFFTIKKHSMSQNHLPVYKFTVDFGGNSLSILEVSGLDLFIQPIRHREGGNLQNSFTVAPGLRAQSTVTLKRHLQKGNNDFFNWINAIEVNDPSERRDVTITLLNHRSEPEFTWKLRSAFPIAYRGPHLQSSDNELASESLDLVYEELRVEAF